MKARIIGVTMAVVLGAGLAAGQVRPGTSPVMFPGAQPSPGPGVPGPPDQGTDRKDTTQTASSNPSPNPKREKVDDGSLQREVHEQMAKHGELANVEVAVQDGIVQLTGSVPRKQDRKWARQLAKSVPGVRGVKEKLTLNTNGGATASSAAGSEAAGVVNTGGAAGASATAGAGATRSNGEGNTNATENPSDRSPGSGPAAAGANPSAADGAANAEAVELAPEIENSLHADPTLANRHLQAQVTDTDIVLTGSVASGKEKENAQRIAESYAANRRVVNKITITGQAGTTGVEGKPK